MSTDEYVPSKGVVRGAYVLAGLPDDASADLIQSALQRRSPEFDRFLARVRRDAVQQFIEACKAKRDEPGFLLPPNHWQDIEAAMRVAESYVKNHPEETP